MIQIPVYELDGADFSTLEEFAAYFSNRVLIDYQWRGNLDAFNDILRGSYGTPNGGFIIRWHNSALSRQRLGHPETARQLERRLSRCHPSNRQSVASKLKAAQSGMGSTVFDWLVNIIREHGKGGYEAQDQIELELL